MSDILRQTSEQYATRITSLEQQITDAEENIKNWRGEIADVRAAKEHVDSKLPRQPAAAAAKPAANP